LIAEEKRMYFRVSKSLSLVLALASVACMPLALAAQDSAKPAAKTAASDSPSKWDIFAGYSYLSPKGTITNTNGVKYGAVNYGAIASVSRYFNNFVGVQGEGDVHALKQTQPSNGDFSGGSLGLILRYPTADLTPFVHGLVGIERVGGYGQSDVEGMVLTVGGGMDYSTPLFDHHLAIRVFQADFQYTHEDFANSQRGNFNVARLSAGLVYHIGSIAPPAPVTLSCSASPNSVFPGDPVTVTASAGSLDPKLNALYSISGAGVNATTATATVATGALAPGSYTVKCGVKEGKPGKEGLKPWEVADASANFTVKAFEPPTVSCSANPTTIKPGETATVTAMGMSPQNRPLTYNYSSTSGSVSGSGTTATFNSAGAPTGAAGITCTVSDDKNQTATGSTSVTIMAPYVAPIPHTETLCSIGFDKDKKRPSRVDNEAKACLDQVAMDLQRQADAKAVVVGSSDAKEKDATAKEAKRALKNKHVKVVDMAAERAVNAKEYLVTDKGIDATRVSVATSAADGQKVEDYLVPSGATFSADVTGTTAVDETTVKPEVRKPLAEKHHAKKAAAKKQ